MCVCVCMHVCTCAVLCVHAYVEATGQLLVSIFVISRQFLRQGYWLTLRLHVSAGLFGREPLVSSFLSFRSPLNPHTCSVLTVKTYWYDYVLCEPWRSKNQVFLLSQQAVYILRQLNPKSMQTLIWLSSLRTFYYAKLLYTGCSNVSFFSYNCLAFCLKMAEPYWMRKTYSRGMMECLSKSKLRIRGDIFNTFRWLLLQASLDLGEIVLNGRNSEISSNLLTTWWW